MTTTYKPSAQVSPSAGGHSALYTIPNSATTATVGCLTVCNTNTSTVKIRVAVRLNGATLATGHYRYFDLPVYANDTIEILRGAELGYGSGADVLDVYADTANVNFHLDYAEIT